VVRPFRFTIAGGRRAGAKDHLFDLRKRGLQPVVQRGACSSSRRRSRLLEIDFSKLLPLSPLSCQRSGPEALRQRMWIDRDLYRERQVIFEQAGEPDRRCVQRRFACKAAGANS